MKCGRVGIWARWIVAGVALSMLLALSAPAHAKAKDVTYHASGCEEVAVLAPTAMFAPDVLLSLAYECERAIIDGEVVAPFRVAEIGVVRATGDWTLLRWAGNHRGLRNRLATLGLPALHSPGMSFDRSATGIVSAVVPIAGAVYRMTGTATTSPFPPEPTRPESSAGATYRNRVGDRVVELAYRWDRQAAVPGGSAVVIDATRDAALTQWLGAATTAAGGVYHAGDWTGSARILP